MIACSHPLFIYSLLFFSLSSFATDEDQFVSDDDEKWQATDDELLAESKLHQASYQHEQALLADIYSPTRTYVSMHDDRVHPSNFSYFTFNKLGTYRFILISSRGDADLYVSTHDQHVSYYNYEFSSCSCGIDEILIESSIKRPIYLAIYGYSQYQVTRYRLLIELVDKKTAFAERGFEQSNGDQPSAEQHTSRTHQNPIRVTAEGEEDRPHPLWTIFLWLLNFLVEVLT